MSITCIAINIYLFQDVTFSNKICQININSHHVCQIHIDHWCKWFDLTQDLQEEHSFKVVVLGLKIVRELPNPDVSVKRYFTASGCLLFVSPPPVYQRAETLKEGINGAWTWKPTSDDEGVADSYRGPVMSRLIALHQSLSTCNSPRKN